MTRTTKILRWKFAAAGAIALACALSLVCIGFNIGFHLIATGRTDALAKIIHENGGDVPRVSTSGEMPDITPETPFETRYFTAQVDASGTIVDMQTDNIAAIDEQEAVQIIESALDRASAEGYVDSYRYVAFSNEDGGKDIVVVDRSMQIRAERDALALSIAVALSCLFIAIMLLIPLSKRALRPFEENLRRQQQFVTDASHELKTPLAIVSANNDLLETSNGTCRWTESTRAQIARMNKLVSDLVELAQAEEMLDRTKFERADLSSLANQVASDFQPLAESAGIELTIDIDDNLFVVGDESRLEKLCGILLENAIKYCDENGTVAFSVKHGKRHVAVIVANDCAGLDDLVLERLFDRFYRADPSRTRKTGGHGIGLSIAQAITSQYGGRLDARKEKKLVVFEATFPQSRSAKSRP